MKKLIALILSLGVFLCGCSFSDRIRIGTAGLGGSYNELGNSLSQILAEQEGWECDVKTTTGSAANVRLLSQGYLDMAIVQDDIAFDAENGNNSFSSAKYSGYSAVAGLYTEVCHIIVKADSKIKTVNDLQNKTVSIGETESGTEQNAKQILSVYGLTDKMLKEINLSYTDAATKLQSGEIDAFFCTVGTGTTIVEELSKQCDIRILSIDTTAFEKLQMAYKSFVDYIIPTDTYSGQTEPVSTVGVKSILVVSDKLDNDKVKKVTSALFDNADKLQLSVSANLELEPKKSIKGVSISFHKGAAEYYKENGIDIAEKED